MQKTLLHKTHLIVAPIRKSLEAACSCKLPLLASAISASTICGNCGQMHLQSSSSLQDCVATEKVDPLMPQLMHYLHHNRPIYAAEGAVLQFELLLAQFGGPKERRRWRGWKESIMVVNGSTQVDKSARIEALACSSSMTEVSNFCTLALLNYVPTASHWEPGQYSVLVPTGDTYIMHY